MIPAAFAIVIVSMLLCAGLCWVVRIVAPRVGLVDNPGGRKNHKAPTPLGGGIAIWMTLGIVLGSGALVLWLGGDRLPREIAVHIEGAWVRGRELLVIFALATAIMILGLLDDRFHIGWKPRIFVQFLLASIFVLSGDRLTMFQGGGVVTASLMKAVTVLWIVGLTNSFNFLDNMDGLAASVGLIAAFLFVVAQVMVESLFVPAVLLVLIGSLAGFLVHNRPPARLFMGDAGSNLLGFLLGVLTVAGTFTRSRYSPYGVLSPLLVMAVPLYDTASVILIRLREGRSPFQPDRCHLSHRLVDRGLTPARAVATIDLITLAGGLGALLLSRATPFTAAVIVAQTVALLGLVAVLEVSTGR
jgi:UDP-GlcNAc:undecaprenyl-phosphate GlcNAc-1-phosphate transferase